MGFFFGFSGGYNAWTAGPDRAFGMAAMIVTGLVAVGVFIAMIYGISPQPPT